MNEIKTRKISLKAAGHKLVQAKKQIEILENDSRVVSFGEKIANLGFSPLRPTSIKILQVNVGYMCNQVCTHCHVDAGPDRKEMMTRENMQHCLNTLEHSNIDTVDITGGAPEMNPEFQWFIEELAKYKVEIIVRSNLTILVSNKKYKTYPEFLKKHNVTVIASLPCYTMENTDEQRGNGVFNSSIQALKLLNQLGYGKINSGLKLHLVYNPGGASIAPPQAGLELMYKKELMENFGIEFNNLFTITNLPISRFLDYLLSSGKYEEYMNTLVTAFNPETVSSVMCRNTLSVSWDGQLYDCDFNQMLQLKVEKDVPQHIRDFDKELLETRKIIIGQHCYGCTAGSGSSCQGALT